MTSDIQPNKLITEVKLTLNHGSQSALARLAGEHASRDCIALFVAENFKLGESARLSVDFLEQGFELEGQLVSCELMEDGYFVLLKLRHTESLKARMLLQLSEIEHYRHQMAQLGRELDIESAAIEWVEKYAAVFSESFDAEVD